MAIQTITEIRIKGYKSLADLTTLELRPLTILAGANSSGKSSVIQPLLLLKQTLASPSEPGVLELAGPNVHFSDFEQMFFRAPGKNRTAKQLQIGFTTGDRAEGSRIDLHYRMHGRNLGIEKQVLSLPEANRRRLTIELKPGPMAEDAVRNLPEVFRQTRDSMNQRSQSAFHFHCQQARGFLDVVLRSDQNPGMGFSPAAFVGDLSLRQALLNLIHIPGLRGNPERDYPLRKTKGPRFDGHFQDYMAGILAGFGKDRLARISDNLHQLGLTWKVEAKPLDATRVQIVVGRMTDSKRGGARDLVNIADVGFGVSQILPALAALEVALPGQLVHLEQPEIHLHPKAQRGLANLLAQAAADNKRLVVETHSSILLRGIQTLVAKGDLDPALIKLHWFTRSDETGATKVTSADLDANGSFGADWPEDFDDTYLESERDYLDAVEARMNP